MSFLLAERAHSESARSMRAVKNNLPTKNEKEESSVYERFIKRWKLYLLFQEPTR